MTQKHRVLVTGAIHEAGLAALRAEPDLELDYRPDLPFAELLECIAPYDCLICRSENPVTRELIERGANLKLVARAAVGVGDIDLAAATERGVLVMNTPGKNTNSAAELSWALLLAVTRKLPAAHAQMAAGGWDRHRFTGTELTGKTIGIVGLGNVGHRVARFAHGFDMRVIAYDPYIPDEEFARHRAEKVDFETLLTESDVVSVHVPKNKETLGMFGAAELSRMKPGVFIVNAARGGIVAEADLLAALKSGQVAGAGLDTWDQEPPRDNPFRDLPNVVMTPHIGASTEEAQLRIAQTIAEQVPRALRGGVVDYPVNMPRIKQIEGTLMVSYTVLAEKLGSFAAQYADFRPDRVEIVYRGDIARHDCTLLRLAFLKGLLGHYTDYVTYVNAAQRAAALGLTVEDREDPGFTAYAGAIKFILRAGEREFSLGGVVFPGPHPRITLVDGFVYEVEPEGMFLAVRSRDRLGVVSAISTILDRHQVLISRFDFSHSQAQKRSMFLIRIAKLLPEAALAELQAHSDILLVRSIRL